MYKVEGEIVSDESDMAGFGRGPRIKDATTRLTCPPESCTPLSPTMASSPSRSWAKSTSNPHDLITDAYLIESYSHPRRTFSLTVPSMIHGSWGA